MNQRTFTMVSGAIFLLIAVLHVLRLIFSWEAVIGGWDVPLWVSWLAIIFAGYLAFSAFKLSK